MNGKRASLKLGGPIRPLASFDATVPSFGMPKMPVSSLRLEPVGAVCSATMLGKPCRSVRNRT